MRDGVGREPEPTEVFCGAEDWAGGFMCGASDQSLPPLDFIDIASLLPTGNALVPLIRRVVAWRQAKIFAASVQERMK